MSSNRRSHISLTLKASSWTLLSFGTIQAFRFLGHLIVARFLIPADFGLMQLVNVFVQGLHMFSDIGVGANVLQHHKGEDEDFLTTAWSVQIIRGAILWGITFLIAWPLAYIYEAPQLNWLLPIAGVGIFIDGLASMNLLVLNRRMNMVRLGFIEVTSSCIGIAAMVLCAWKWQSVWTLLVAGIVSAILKGGMSHLLFVSHKMRLNWHSASAAEIIHFGKWIFLSSLTGFLLVSRLDRIFLGIYLTKGDLGLYGIASSIVMLFIEIVQMISGKVLIPLYAKLKQESPEDLKPKVFHIRLLVTLMTVPPLVILAIWGQQLMDVLYPSNYQGTGWMVQILAVGGIFKVINATILPILISMGDSFRLMAVQSAQSVVMIALLFVGGYYYGVTGLIVAAALPELATYPLLAAAIYKYKVWLPELDLAIFLGAAALSAFLIFG